MNKVELVARLGKDPEVSYLPGGKPIVKLRVAYNVVEKLGLSGSTYWFTVIFFGFDSVDQIAEMKKGDLVTIEGSLVSREWKGRDGNTKSVVEILAKKLAKYERSKTSFDHAKAAANDLDDSPAN